MRENLKKNSKNQNSDLKETSVEEEKKKKKKQRENPPLWIEENEEEELFIVAVRISFFGFFFL
jgi:hypothetical protein